MDESLLVDDVSELSESQDISDTEEEDQWRVEAIRADKKDGRKTLYLIKWEGYPDSDSTWEPATNIHKDLLQEYLLQAKNV